jgi:hypothetical protein
MEATFVGSGSVVVVATVVVSVGADVPVVVLVVSVDVASVDVVSVSVICVEVTTVVCSADDVVLDTPVSDVSGGVHAADIKRKKKANTTNIAVFT